jgi:putative ABC transport system ATP-binding protein
MTTTVAVNEAVQLWSVSKVYSGGRQAVTALRSVTTGFPPGSFTAIMGPSGSGKSTLLHCAAGLDRPTEGKVFVAGTDLGELTERALTRLRRERVGFIFQSFNLVPSLTASDNVALPMRLGGRRPSRPQVRAALAAVGVADRARHRPSELSGGEQQRVAIARALVTHPTVIFADEPTGALDTKASHEVLGLLRDAVDRHGQTVVMVSHDPVAASYADRLVFLADGQIVDEVKATEGTARGAEAIASRMVRLEKGR